MTGLDHTLTAPQMADFRQDAVLPLQVCHPDLCLVLNMTLGSGNMDHERT